jgi:hypothetical protein
MSNHDALVLKLRFSRSAKEYWVEEVDSGAIISVGVRDTLHLFPESDPRTPPKFLTPEEAKSAGRRIYDLFFNSAILEQLRAIRSAAPSADPVMRVHLDLEGAEDLDNIPWELLAAPGSDDAILPLRHIPVPGRTPKVSVAKPLRIVAILADPADLPFFDTDREWETLTQSLESLITNNSVFVERLEDCTESGLRCFLSKQVVQVLHFVGYGRSNLQARYGSLFFEGDGRKARALSAEYLSSALCPKTRLVVLDFGRQVDDFNPFSETARHLVRNGLDSVIAMRRRLSGPAARMFYQSFYSSLASGNSIDQSVATARSNMAEASQEVEWDIPMLYAASGDQIVIASKVTVGESAVARDLSGAETTSSAEPKTSDEKPAIVISRKIRSKGNDKAEEAKFGGKVSPSREGPRKIKKILILAASPENLTTLRLGQEIREIDAGLRRAKYRQRFQLEQRLAVRPLDLQQAMIEIEPQIVHFCGHGAGQDGLIFEDNNGLSFPVSGTALANLFELFSSRVECVVLNSCHSEIQADAISEHIRYVVGMKKQIGDRAAIDFAIGFYCALGAGYAIDFAFRLGCSAIELENLPENLTPIMQIRPSGKEK